MWPLGHAAVGYLLYTVLARRHASRPSALAAVAVVVAAQIPDLIDKPLAWYGGILPTGRSLGHGLVVVCSIGAVAYWLARRYGRPAVGVAVAVGTISHPLVDATPALWGGTDARFLLYPFVELTPVEGAPTLADLLGGALTNPWFLFEFVLGAIALVVWYRDGRPGLAAASRLARRFTDPA